MEKFTWGMLIYKAIKCISSIKKGLDFIIGDSIFSTTVSVPVNKFRTLSSELKGPLLPFGFYKTVIQLFLYIT